MATLPESAGMDTAFSYEEKPTNTFIIDWAAKQISGMDAGLSAMRQAVDIILHNERFRWQIYSSDFGSELEDLVGEEYDYVISELPRRIEEAFSVDRRILSVDHFVFSDEGKDTITCSFDVVTVFGTFGREVVL